MRKALAVDVCPLALPQQLASAKYIGPSPTSGCKCTAPSRGRIAFDSISAADGTLTGPVGREVGV
jgi:hypothetical protein